MDAKDTAMDDQEFNPQLQSRHRFGRIMLLTFQASTVVGVVILIVLLLNIMNSAFGYVAIQNEIAPESLAIDGVALDDLTKEQLITILEAHVSAGLIRRLENDLPFAERSEENILELIYERVVEPQVVDQWSFWVSMTQREEIFAVRSF